ncbi:MAG: hypothetical protein F4X79_10420 [Acidobacteria bacterium]|nr:hypothetical protein [Acidobacteriota bacterium]
MPKLPSRYLDTLAMFEESRPGQLRYAGTGFFCRYFTGGAEGRTLLFLVTSDRAASGDLGYTSLVFGRSKGFNRITYPAGCGGRLALGDWLVDSERGVALLPLDPERLKEDAIRCETFDLWGGTLESWQMRKRGVGEGDDVLVLGFAPERLRLRPVTMVRKGIVARIQDFYGRRSPTFLVEATTFAGNTGSPVVIRPAHGKKGQPLTHPRPHLIGLVSDSLPNPEQPVPRDQEGRAVLVRVHTGLVRVIPVDAIVGMVRMAAGNSSP